MAQVFHAVIEGKRWQIASIHGRPGHEWAWLVNVEKTADQRRCSMRHPALAGYLPKREAVA